ncbi:PD-(D/E)XK nuclease family protein [Aequorivita echinoideorum]|uniref:PD-(D/E)XK nuclease family protein n=1 Tax=Aequorivita echinoideorum TaxID=1549647 RepID=A0ABS5S1E7_9FLAO|nr:PD-(D/E)XK nuclease family protein [Aequorivita echinoideorum]MBT0607043.1 PD-(D/E)XK nuclease family protein [Aequorivita echinoideorum]
MRTFLQETLSKIKNEHSDLSALTFILPSRRAGGFLKNELKSITTSTQFAPTIWSIEEFVEELSDLKIKDNIELIFKIYHAYLLTESIKEKEDFETFSTWANTLLNDFNEVDRYLINPVKFFNYLADIKNLERWGVNNEQTPLVQNYLRFWNSLFELYENIQSLLLKENAGYQGMVYREAASAIEHYISVNGNKKHIFIGFNALNAAEQQIIQVLLETGNSEIFWDIDEWFFNDDKHSASYFVRGYLKEWPYFDQHKLNFIANNFQKNKHFKIVEAQKNIAQVKFVGETLMQFSDEELSKTAIVLGDETLLLPLLHSLPKNIQNLNITMGAPLKGFPAVVFFELLFMLHLRKTDVLYYKDILAILNHPLCASLLPSTSSISEKIIESNTTHIAVSYLVETFSPDAEIIKLLFQNWDENSVTALESCQKIIEKLQNKFQENRIERVVLHELHSIFKKIKALNGKYPHLKSIKTVQSLYNELVASASLDFKGDAYNGLQIMGVLETRVLDFENVIITSVNEGIFPSGKSNASFITYDLKQHFKLPLYTEKDAIYTYHFYRLLHRASNVTLLYNNFSEGINTGEKSRFLMQLEIEKHPNHTIEKIVITPKVQLRKQGLKRINKTAAVMQRLEEIAKKGFSPSALTSYIRNPLEFYFQKILRLQEFEEMEETVAANTLGSIVHDTLETFYKPFENSILKASELIILKSHIHDEVTRQFKKTFRGGDFSKGKNLIIFEVAKRHVSNFIDREIADVNEGNVIEILKIETNLTLQIAITELHFPVNIHGKIDRADRYNGQLRIIDYKTGRVNQNDVELIDWEELTQEYKYSKAFQILAYALMMDKELPITNAEAGIISFKNLQSGFLKFGTKESGRGPKNQLINEATLEYFTRELKKLILEICDPNIPFTEKEID